MSNDPNPIAQTGSYLRFLLGKPPYRVRWEATARRLRGNEINIDAVSRVIARYRDPYDPTGGDFRSINDTVRRALDGKVLTVGLLNEFISAFDIQGADASRLRDLLRGSTQALIVADDFQPSASLQKSIGEARHETQALHEFHEIGPNRMPTRHRTIQTIMAISDNLDHYPYRFDTNAAAVEIIRGGQRGDLYQISGTDLYAVDIRFPRAIACGETALVEYATTFDYSDPPPPQFRRAVLRQTNALTISVQFDSETLPATVWRARWASVEDPESVVWSEREELDAAHSVHWSLGVVSRAIVGYFWSWDGNIAECDTDAT